MSSYTFMYADREMTLTTERGESSYGIPVLVVDGNAYGKDDIMPKGHDELGWLYEMDTAGTTVHCYRYYGRKDGTFTEDEGVNELIDRFLA